MDFYPLIGILSLPQHAKLDQKQHPGWYVDGTLPPQRHFLEFAMRIYRRP